jgi:hypothetical protein
MKKINSKKLFIQFEIGCLIDSDQVDMHHVRTGEIKRYNEIEESDMENWILNDSAQVIRDCDEIEHEDIEFRSAE